MSRAPRRAPVALTLALSLGGWAAGAVQAQERPTSPPPPLAERPITFPGFADFRLENGLRVVVVEYGTQPLTSARLYFPTGSASEAPGQEGLASLTGQLLTQGTTTRSAEEFAATIEGVGGTVSASGGRDQFTIFAFALTEHLDLAMELMADAALNATFPEDEVELMRRRVLSSLQAEQGQPQAIANRHFRKLLYGDMHPYGRSSTPESVRALTRDDLVAFRDRALTADGALLVLAGRITRDEAERLAQRHFSALPTGSAVVVDFPEVADAPSPRIVLVNRPGSAQSVISIGNPGVRPGDPDYFPLVVMDRVLGGGADSRLFRILREEKGWTYGAYSSFDRPADVGVVSAGTEVRTEVTDSALVEIVNQLHRLRNEPVPDDELEGAINFLAGSFPLRLETADQVATQVANTLFRGRPMEEVTEYPQRIRAVTAEDVQRVANRYLRPEGATLLVVGDGPRITESLEAIAPVDFMAVDGTPLTRDVVMGVGAAVAAWDAAALTPHTRRYDVYMQDNVLGSAEYQLQREGDEWVAVQTQNVAGTTARTEIRFDDALTPRSLSQETGGMMAIRADLRVEDGRIIGDLQLPPQAGGDRELDEELPAGALLSGMDEYALALGELGPDARLTLPVFDVTQGTTTQVQARVIGEERIALAGGEFDTWQVELSGGPLPLILYLRKEAPHYLIRQEFAGQPIRFDLTLLDESR